MYFKFIKLIVLLSLFSGVLRVCGKGFVQSFFPIASYKGKIHVTVTKQLLDEVEHDIMNYQSRGLCYLPKPKAEADNTDTRV